MEGYIYISKQYQPDGNEVKYSGFTILGVGRTNNINRRLNEHNKRSSKDSTTIKFTYTIKVDDVIAVEKKLHNKLVKIGYVKIRNEMFTYNKYTNENINESIIIDIIKNMNKKSLDGEIIFTKSINPFFKKIIKLFQ